MSTVIENPRSPYTRPARKKRRFNIEKWAWLFMRGSGVILVFLIFGHLFFNLMLGEGIRAIDFGFVGGKLANPFWQWWDVLMLWLALIHGGNGMRTVINDYVTGQKLRPFILWTLFAIVAILIVLGTLVTFTFDPCPITENIELLPSFCNA
ncbi:MAG: succinate dehydrogenase hydrophobic membrane anchor subunit [Microbacteriaceae bacterium]|nr:succinate dehydrogenase hydrophobic membrane anchor subunit [Microbacteriaceae bacterium]